MEWGIKMFAQESIEFAFKVDVLILLASARLKESQLSSY